MITDTKELARHALRRGFGLEMRFSDDPQCGSAWSITAKVVSPLSGNIIDDHLGYLSRKEVDELLVYGKSLGRAFTERGYHEK